MIVDFAASSDVLKVTVVNYIKLLVVSYFVFYKIPQYIFPQTNIKDYLDRFVFNSLYMIASVIFIVPLLLLLKIFSFPTLILSFLLLKAILLYYFEKRNFLLVLRESYQRLLIYIYDAIDSFYEYLRFGKKYTEYKRLFAIKDISLITIIKYLFFIVAICYIFYEINVINFISMDYRASDMPVYLEWISKMHKNRLYPETFKGGAYFFAPATIIFFLQIITNIDTNIILNLYPSLFFLYLLMSIYYLIYKTTNSFYSSMFAVIIFTLYGLSPVSIYFLGYNHTTTNPHIVNFLGMSIYFDLFDEFKGKALGNFSIFPFSRINSGLPYEMAFTFYSLYIYFFIKSLEKKKTIFILLYSITLMIIFSLHGGAAIYLFVSSVFILINAIIFGKVNLNIIKKGIVAIFISTILGNLWLLSIFKFGLPGHVGVAAPILDKLLQSEQNKEMLLIYNIESIHELIFYKIQLFIYFLLTMLYPLKIIFSKKRFVLSSIALSIIALIIIFIEQNLGFGQIVSKSRSCEYLILGVALGAGLYFNFLEKLIVFLFKRVSNYILMAILIAFFITSVFAVPTWNDTKQFYSLVNNLQYNSVVYDIYKIRKMRMPNSWTIVAFVQSYPRVLGKGFHINAQTFLKEYNPTDKYLKIPTSWIYIFKESIPSGYKGSGEWYFRWKKDIQLQLETWLTIYSKYHHNIRVFDDRKYLTVYEIDNRAYTKYLYERKMKNAH